METRTIEQYVRKHRNALLTADKQTAIEDLRDDGHVVAMVGDGIPVRSDVEVLAAGPRGDATYGVMGRLISYVTGAAQEDGFGGLAGGIGDPRNLLTFDRSTRTRRRRRPGSVGPTPTKQSR
jgi:hypothetical protein